MPSHQGGRGLARYPDRLVMITARSEQEALRAAFDAGATDYIKKPFEEVELLARIKVALKLKKEIDARKNWEQELTKTISELDAALREMVTLQQLIPVCPACKKSLADQTSESALETYIQIHPQCQAPLHGQFQLCEPPGVALALFRIEEARQDASITQASTICIEHFSRKEHVPSLLLFTQEGWVAGTCIRAVLCSAVTEPLAYSLPPESPPVSQDP